MLDSYTGMDIDTEQPEPFFNASLCGYIIRKHMGFYRFMGIFLHYYKHVGNLKKTTSANAGTCVSS